MATTTKTLDQLIDLSIEKFSPWQQRVIARRVGRFGRRQKLREDVAFAMSSDPRFDSLIENKTVFTGDVLTGDTPIEFDPANLEEILRILVEYLPQIIQLFMVLFAQLLLPLAIAVGLSSSANAQGTICVDGTCYRLPAAQPTSPPDLAGPVRKVVRTVAPNLAGPRLIPSRAVESIATQPAGVPQPVIYPVQSVKVNQQTPIRQRSFFLRPRTWRIASWFRR